jgi:hypothetical protein
MGRSVHPALRLDTLIFTIFEPLVRYGKCVFCCRASTRKRW